MTSRTSERSACVKSTRTRRRGPPYHTWPCGISTSSISSRHRGLRAQLKVRYHSMANPRLYIRQDKLLPFPFQPHRRGLTTQESFGPERNGPKHLPPSFAAMPSAVDPAMRTHPLHGVDVIAPDAVAKNQSALPRTVHEVFDGGDRDDGIGVHNRSAPKALVVSAEPRGSNRTLCHPA